MEKRGSSLSLKFVLDSSVTMAWFFHDETAPSTDELLDRLTEDAQDLVDAHIGHWK